MYSQLNLFEGLTEDLKKVIQINRSSLVNHRENSARKDIGSSGMIQTMLDCKTAVEMWKIQKKLKEPMLLDVEKPRWIIRNRRI